MSFEYVTRQEWGAVGPRSIRPVAPEAFTAIEVHHTAGTTSGDGAAIMRNTQAFHMGERNYQDIFYNWLVHPDGTIYQGRGWVTSARRENFMLICMIGNYENLEVTDAQRESVAAIVAESWERMPQLVGKDVRWHGQRSATACPGGNTIEFVQEMNELGWSLPLVQDSVAPSLEDRVVALEERIKIMRKGAAQYRKSISLLRKQLDELGDVA